MPKGEAPCRVQKTPAALLINLKDDFLHTFDNRTKTGFAFLERFKGMNALRHIDADTYHAGDLAIGISQGQAVGLENQVVYDGAADIGVTVQCCANWFVIVGVADDLGDIFSDRCLSQAYRIVWPSALAMSSTAVSAVLFSRSRIGFDSTTSKEPAMPDSAMSSQARWASR